MKHLPWSSQHDNMCSARALCAVTMTTCAVRMHSVEFIYGRATISDIASYHIVLSCVLRNTAFATRFNFLSPWSKALCILSDLMHCCMNENAYFYVAGFSPQTAPDHNCFMALFPAPPGWAGARRELLDFMVQGKINRGRHTAHPAGHHSIWTNQCPPPPSAVFCNLQGSTMLYGAISEIVASHLKIDQTSIWCTVALTPRYVLLCLNQHFILVRTSSLRCCWEAQVWLCACLVYVAVCWLTMQSQFRVRRASTASHRYFLLKQRDRTVAVDRQR